MSDDSRDFEHEESRQETHDLEDLVREDGDDVEDEKESRFNYDNDDAEDDEEDEDDEDLVRSRKRSRPERNRFLDVEAEVSDDEDDEEDDDDDLTKEGFIAADHENEAEEALRRDDRLHRQVDRSHEKSTEEDAQRLAAEFKERYGRTNKYRGDDSGFVSQRFLLPSINDPSIWAIRCRQGKEKELVRKLLQRKLTLEGKPNALKILSAFQRDNFTGYLYIEAEKLTSVEVAIRGFPDIYPQNKILVPVEEFPDLLRASKSSDIKITPGSYVRIKRGTYKGDLAIVDAVEENGLEVTLQVVPRLDYKGQIDDTTGKRKRVTSTFRPPQRLFSKKDALEFDPHNLIVRSSNTFVYKGEEYIDGYLYKLFKLQFLETQSVQPKLDEVSKFNTGDQDELDLTSIAQSLKASHGVAFNVGDRVQVTSGEQKDLQGDVVSSSNDTVLLKPRGFQTENLEIPTSILRKIFGEGDHISVLSGKHSGHTGIVVSTDEDKVTFISDQSNKDITCFANHLTKSIDSSTIDESAYSLHDLVRLNQTSVGVIINTEKDVFTVLSQDGKVLSLPPSAIISKINVRKDQAFGSDANGQPIKIGDSVKEIRGFKRTGAILHIFRNLLFVYSKETTENSGIFSTDISSVAAVASKAETEKEGKDLDLTQMNPKLRNVTAMPPPSLPTKQLGRDRIINMHVAIVKGPYKGLRGIVKDTNGEIARVELHTKNKTLSIGKDKLSIVDSNSGSLIAYEEFMKQKQDFRSKGPTYTSSNNGYSSGNVSGASSHWAGSASSGGATARGANGSGTSWGSSVPAGNGTSWGGSGTSYGAGAGTAWGNSNAGSGTSWGNAGGNNTSWGTAGQQSSWGNQTGQASHYGGGSQWGNTGGNTGYDGGSSWGGSRSAYGSRNQTWNAQTPGTYQTAETPGGYAETPSAAYAQTPGASYAPTPGASYASTPGATYAQTPGATYAQTPGRYDAPTPGTYN